MMVRIYFKRMGARICENVDIHWERAERRHSALTRHFTTIPIQVRA